MSLLRVSQEGELQGLDIDQHGISAYPDYQISVCVSSRNASADRLIGRCDSSDGATILASLARRTPWLGELGSLGQGFLLGPLACLRLGRNRQMSASWRTAGRYAMPQPYPPLCSR